MSREAERAELRSRVDDLRRRCESYNVGDRPMSPPAALMKERWEAEQALRAFDAQDPRGVFRKYIVTRTDGSDAAGGKHHGCAYFVLDLDHDEHARAALLAYAKSCRTSHPQLSHDLYEALAARPCGCRSVGECMHGPGDVSGVVQTKMDFDEMARGRRS